MMYLGVTNVAQTAPIPKQKILAPSMSAESLSCNCKGGIEADHSPTIRPNEANIEKRARCAKRGFICVGFCGLVFFDVAPLARVAGEGLGERVFRFEDLNQIDLLLK